MLLLWDISYGPLTQLYAGTSPEAANLGGQVSWCAILHWRSSSTDVEFQYLIPWARIGTPRADTQDPQLGKELWTWLEEQVAV
jgi:hypothetical protein